MVDQLVGVEHYWLSAHVESMMSDRRKVVFLSEVNTQDFSATTVLQMGFYFNYPSAQDYSLDRATTKEQVDVRLWTDGFRPMWRVE